MGSVGPLMRGSVVVIGTMTILNMELLKNDAMNRVNTRIPERHCV
jgi:hypothetical protein